MWYSIVERFFPFSFKRFFRPWTLSTSAFSAKHCFSESNQAEASFRWVKKGIKGGRLYRMALVQQQQQVNDYNS